MGYLALTVWAILLLLLRNELSKTVRAKHWTAIGSIMIMMALIDLVFDILYPLPPTVFYMNDCKVIDHCPSQLALFASVLRTGLVVGLGVWTLYVSKRMGQQSPPAPPV